jgi:hypothetical protein
MADERKRKRALRDELRNFYLQQQQQEQQQQQQTPVDGRQEGVGGRGGATAGSNNSSSTSSAATAAAAAANIHDLDSPSFKATAYMRHILKNQTLPELLKSDAELMKGASLLLFYLVFFPPNPSSVANLLSFSSHCSRFPQTSNCLTTI